MREAPLLIAATFFWTQAACLYAFHDSGNTYALLIAAFDLMCSALRLRFFWRRKTIDRNVGLIDDINILCTVVWIGTIGITALILMQAPKIESLVFGVFLAVGFNGYVISRFAAFPIVALLMLGLLDAPLTIGLLISPYLGLSSITFLTPIGGVASAILLMNAHTTLMEAIRTKEASHWLSRHDILTGLPNRLFMQSRLQELIGRAADDGRTSFTVMFIDLDGFKLVNDSYGHQTGDALLVDVARRLETLVAEYAASVFRLGGDEFAVIVENETETEPLLLADAIVSSMMIPFGDAGSHCLSIGASLGLAHSPLHGDDPTTLLARADIALYAAKTAGRRTYKVFQNDMEYQVLEKNELDDLLRECLKEKRYFFVFYQPIVEISSGRVTGREALIRWHHAERGWISPGRFIPVAEENELIHDIGRWVLHQACRDAVSWADGARVAVNVSARQLGAGTLVPIVLGALAESGLASERLEIEITESTLLRNAQGCLEELRQIRAIGVRVALDDFGTGFSSLTHLRLFPFDKIKIDGSFMRDPIKRSECAAIIGVVAELGRRLGVTTVAEGVETQADLDLVKREGCTEVQGYLLGRPGPRAQDAARVADLESRPRDLLRMAS